MTRGLNYFLMRISKFCSVLQGILLAQVCVQNIQMPHSNPLLMTRMIDQRGKLYSKRYVSGNILYKYAKAGNGGIPTATGFPMQVSKL